MALVKLLVRDVKVAHMEFDRHICILMYGRRRVLISLRQGALETEASAFSKRP